MTDHLSDARYTLSHAKRRISEFEAEVKAFVDSQPYARVIETDPTGSKIYKIKMTKPLPIALKGIALDIVVNLRAALDQAGFAIARAFKKGTGKHAHFPFGSNPGEVASRHKHQSKDLPKQIFDVMAAFMPYKGGND